MKTKYSLAGIMLALFSNMSGADMSVAHEYTTQYVFMTNLLGNAADTYPARTQTPIKVDVYQGNNICYTVPYISFGDQYTFKASPYNPACLYMSRLVITPLKVGNLQVYDPATLMVAIAGSPVTRTQVTVIQKPSSQEGTGNAPVFNSDGTVTPGVADYQLGSAFSALDNND